MTPIKKPTDHLRDALRLIMAAAGDARNLLFFFTTNMIHIHSLSKGGDNEEEAKFRMDPEYNDDHHFSCLLMIQGVVYPWAVEKCKEPSDKMIEGMVDMIGHFAAAGWADMVSKLYIPISLELSQGASGMSEVYETLKIHGSLTESIGHLFKYEEAKKALQSQPQSSKAA